MPVVEHHASPFLRLRRGKLKRPHQAGLGSRDTVMHAALRIGRASKAGRKQFALIGSSMADVQGGIPIPVIVPSLIAVPAGAVMTATDISKIVFSLRVLVAGSLMQDLSLCKRRGSKRSGS